MCCAPRLDERLVNACHSAMPQTDVYPHVYPQVYPHVCTQVYTHVYTRVYTHVYTHEPGA